MINAMKTCAAAGMMLSLAGMTNAAVLSPDDASLVSNLRMWLDAEALGLSDGASVNTWTDSSANGNHAVANSGGSYVSPKVKQGIFGGNDAVRFDQAASELMKAENLLGDSEVVNGTILVVYQTDSTNEIGRPVGFGAINGGGAGAVHWNLAPEPSLRFDGTAIPKEHYQQDNRDHPDAGFMIRTSTKADKTFNEYFGGAHVLQDHTNNAVNAVVDDFRLGDLHTSALPPGVTTADVAEVIVYDRVLSDTERQGVEQYLAAKYNAADAHVRGYWRFENGLDGQSDPGTAGHVLDATGYENHGTAKSDGGSILGMYDKDSGHTPVVALTGAANRRVYDNSRNEANYIEVAHDESLSFDNQSFTIEAFVKHKDVAGRQYVVQKKQIGQSDLGLNYAFLTQIFNLSPPNKWGKTTGITGNELGLHFADGVNQGVAISSLEITDEAWHYVAVSFDAANDQIIFRLDDQVEIVAGIPIDPAANTGSMLIAAHTNAAGDFDNHSGMFLDELRISSGVLSPDQLLIGATVIPEPATAGLIALVGSCMLRRRR